MKVSLIQPKSFNIWEALGIGYIGAFIKKEYKDNLEIKAFQGYFDTGEQIVDNSQDCNIVGFSCTSPTFLTILIHLLCLFYAEAKIQLILFIYTFFQQSLSYLFIILNGIYILKSYGIFLDLIVSYCQKDGDYSLRMIFSLLFFLIQTSGLCPVL